MLLASAHQLSARSYSGYSGGTGLPASFAQSGPGPARPSAPPAQTFNDPFKVEVVPFAPGKKTGPISNHRDGGGPDRDADDGGDVGLPV